MLVIVSTTYGLLLDDGDPCWLTATGHAAIPIHISDLARLSECSTVTLIMWCYLPTTWAHLRIRVHAYICLDMLPPNLPHSSMV